MKKAFTLIELLVVIAIIAILAAILFPVFAQAKLAAKKSAGLAQMKQIGTGLQIYLADNDDTLPGYRWSVSSGAINPYYLSLAASDPKKAKFDSDGANTIKACFFNQMLAPYIKNDDIWKVAGNSDAWANYQDKGTWDVGFFAYGGQNSVAANNYLLKSNAAMSATSVENVSNTLLFADATYYNALPAQPTSGACTMNGFTPTGSYPHYWKHLGNNKLNFGALGNPDPDDASNIPVLKNIDARYSGQINVVRVDTSAKSLNAKAVVYDLRAKGPTQSMWSPFKTACE
ncbi:MAG: prepilin-type N-terminal cleavage/methylation domain-containing protein [Armatimonadetes bacterium]|nr:prepilin-type N-terminal cleavage/methylation domain-containing protein [Armatimonadota bacterium]